MRLISALLIIFILGADWITPCDEDEHAIATEQVIDIIDLQGEPHTDLCSPFCACQCCHFHSAQPEAFQLNEVTLHSPKLPNTHVLSSALLVHAIWQPPRGLI